MVRTQRDSTAGNKQHQVLSAMIKKSSYEPVISVSRKGVWRLTPGKCHLRRRHLKPFTAFLRRRANGYTSAQPSFPAG